MSGPAPTHDSIGAVTHGGWGPGRFVPLSLPVVMLALLIGLAACTPGNGVRVATAGSAPVVPSAGAATPSTLSAAERTDVTTLPLPALRTLIARSDQARPKTREQASSCPSCFRTGPAVALVGKGSRDRLVLVRDPKGVTFALYLVADAGRGPSVVWSYVGADVSSARVKRQVLTLTDVVYGPDRGPCCPTGTKVLWFGWDGSRMAKMGEVYRPRVS